MNEQSHKDEMAAALRADFERLRARGVEPTLAPPDDERAAFESAAIEPPTAGVRPSWLTRVLGRG